MKEEVKLFKRLYAFMHKYRSKLLLILLLLPLGSVTYSVQPLIIQKAVDGPMIEADLNALWSYVWVFLFAVVANFLIQILQFWLVNSTGQHIVANIRQALFEHLESLSLSYFDKTPVGRSVSRITNDVEKLSDSFAGGLVLVALDLCNILGMLAFMFYLNFKLSLCVLVFLLPMTFITVYYQKKYRKADLKSAEELSRLNSFLQQNVVGISVVHVLNSAKKSMEKFSLINKKYFEENNNCVQADAQLSAIIELISFIATAVLVYYSAIMIYNFDENQQMISIGVILAFLQYAQALFEPIRNLSDRSAIILSAFTASKRIDEVLEEKVELQDPVSAEVLDLSEKPGVPLVEFKNVWFRYSAMTDELRRSPTEALAKVDEVEWVLKDFSFKLYHAEKLALLGRTGSGKSTIIKLLTRLYDPEQGEILINGVSIKNFKQAELREKLAVIHQDSYVFAGNLEDNIKLSRDPQKLDLNFIQPIVKLSNQKLTKQLSERATNISSGEQQVLNFARALITKPEFVILDEATAKIDLKTEAEIQKFLWSYLDTKTAIIIAHRLDTVKNCDRVLEL